MSCRMWSGMETSSRPKSVNEWKTHQTTWKYVRKATKTHDYDSICKSVTRLTPSWRVHMVTSLFYGVVDKMPLRPVITASCPTDRRTQQPWFFFSSPPPPEIRPGCTEAKPKHSAVILHAWRGEDVRLCLLPLLLSRQKINSDDSHFLVSTSISRANYSDRSAARA